MIEVADISRPSIDLISIALPSCKRGEIIESRLIRISCKLTQTSAQNRSAILVKGGHETASNCFPPFAATELSSGFWGNLRVWWKRRVPVERPWYMRWTNIWRQNRQLWDSAIMNGAKWPPLNHQLFHATIVSNYYAAYNLSCRFPVNYYAQ